MDHTIQNTTEIRCYNTKKIIEYLRFNPCATKKELAEKLELSFVTISNICNSLVMDGILDHMTTNRSSGGRIPEQLFLKPEARYSIAIDLTKAGIVGMSVVNLLNEVVVSDVMEISSALPLKQTVDRMREKMSEMIAENGLLWEAALGVGVSVSDVRNRSGRSASTQNTVLENQLLKDIMQNAFAMPVIVESESNILALATAQEYGRARGVRDLVYLLIGDTLRIGIISKGSLVTGFGGISGKISHMPIGRKAYKCYCGMTGCVESELVHSGFLRAFNERSETNLPLTRGGWDRFVGLVGEGDPDAVEILEENGRLLGMLLSILENIFDSDVFHIGGLPVPVFEAMHRTVVRELHTRTAPRSAGEIRVENSEDIRRLIRIGCAELVLKNWAP